MKWRTPFNHSEFPNLGEINLKPSMTIPDETMTIKEILARHARGLNITGEKVPIYEGEDSDFPDLKHMDLADRQAYLEQAQEELEAIKRSIADRKKKSTTPPPKIENNLPSDPPKDGQGDNPADPK